MNKIFEIYKANLKGIVLMIIAGFFTAFGQLLWKISGNINLFFGFCCYGLGAILMIISFKYGKCSILHPIMSVSYIFALVFGKIFLNESINFIQLIGILLVCVGVGFLGYEK